MTEALRNIEEGKLVGGQMVCDVRFANNQGMVSITQRGLQKRRNKLNDNVKKVSMKINIKKGSV